MPIGLTPKVCNDDSSDKVYEFDLGAGAWLIHVVLISTGKIIIDTIPGMTQQISWTLVNMIYLAVCHLHSAFRLCPDPCQISYLMFHWVTGIPFENSLHGGAYDDLTMWEQIDDGAQYTPAKKWLFSVPVVLSVHSVLPEKCR